MSEQSNQLPPEVLRALEALEGAKTPTEIGAAYATVVAWRAEQPRSYGLLSKATIFIVALGAALYLFGGFDEDISEFWRGALLGGGVVTLLYILGGGSSRRSHLQERADTALDRWRHAFPR